MVAESGGGDTWHEMEVDCARLFPLKSAGLTLRRKLPLTNPTNDNRSWRQLTRNEGIEMNQIS